MPQNPSVMMMMTGCFCNNYGNFNNYQGSASSSKSRKDDMSTAQPETVLSSNIRFQAISAIAVAQDGVINIADQGMLNNLYGKMFMSQSQGFFMGKKPLVGHYRHS